MNNTMTEHVASEKWCPMVRSTTAITKATAGPAANSYHGRDSLGREVQPYATCIGARCMMWRATGSGMGYCGLGGQP